MNELTRVGVVTFVIGLGLAGIAMVIERGVLFNIFFLAAIASCVVGARLATIPMVPWRKWKKQKMK